MVIRHDLVWLKPEAWHDHLNNDILRPWRQNNWPMVVTRQQCCDPLLIQLGVATPEKVKVLIQIKKFLIAEHSKPLRLKDAIRGAPQAWRQALTNLTQQITEIYTYGSLSWQTLTSQQYLTSSSDIDVIVPVKDSHEADALTPILRSAQAPLDGEFIFPEDQAVNWKEWANSNSSQVLVKSTGAVFLASRSSFNGGEREL